MRDLIHKKEYDKIYHQKNKGRWVKSKEYHREVVTRWRAKDPGYAKKASQEHYQKNREKITQQSDERRTPEWKKEKALTRIRKLEIIAGRNKPEQCEVCGSSTRIVFDHNHSTGRFRGWICNSCNVILGQARDNKSVLQKLVKYLEVDIPQPLLESPIKVNKLLANRFNKRTVGELTP